MTALPRCERCQREVAADALFCSMCGAPRVRSDDSLIGTLLADRYVVHKRLGLGGSGNIYQGEHATLRRKVAIKVLHHELSRDDLAVERFRREATTVSQIDNEHIVEVLDFGRLADGRLFLAMEFLEGETLLDALGREGRLPIAKVVDVLVQLGEALMEAHAMGYVHRDLRPRNVFLARRRGVDGFVKLLDFGLAKLVEREGEAASTSLGMTFGDPHYMSPEQAHGEPVDRRADIYSLGIMAFQMLTGRPPFLGEKVFDVLTKHLEEAPPLPSSLRPDVPAWLDAIVLRMLAKRPDDRFVTVYRLVEALKEGQATGKVMSDEVAKRAVTAPPPAPAPRSREFETVRETAVVRVPGAPPAEPPPSASSQAMGKAAQRGPGASDAGISGAWYADGEAMEDDGKRKDGGAGKTAPVGARAQNGAHRPSWSQDVVYDDGPAHRRRLIVGGVVAAVLLGIVVAVLAWPGGKKAASGEVAPPDAAPVEPTAAVAADVAGATVAPPDAAVAASAADAGVAVAVAKPAGGGGGGGGNRPRDERPPAGLTVLRERVDAAPPGGDDGEPVSADAAQAEFYVKLGRSALGKGDAAGAESNFNKAREFDARSADAIAGLGEVAMLRRQFEDAVVHLEAAARLAPRSARILTLLGQAYQGANRPKKAAEAFRRALKIDPGNDGARRGLDAANRSGGE
jgi:tRNA A-37 threonylcarbamoyl transferase component Bud32